MNVIHDDGSLTLDNASVQRLMEMGVLHYTDEGIYAGRWPVTNTPSREHDRESRNSSKANRENGNG